MRPWRRLCLLWRVSLVPGDAHAYTSTHTHGKHTCGQIKRKRAHRQADTKDKDTFTHTLKANKHAHKHKRQTHTRRHKRRTQAQKADTTSKRRTQTQRQTHTHTQKDKHTYILTKTNTTYRSIQRWNNSLSKAIKFLSNIRNVQHVFWTNKVRHRDLDRKELVCACSSKQIFWLWQLHSLPIGFDFHIRPLEKKVSKELGSESK